MNNVENINDHMGFVCECGSVKFNLLKSKKIECIKCGKVHQNPAKIDINILLDSIVSASRGEPFDPDFIPTIEEIAKSWDAELSEEDIQALYDLGPKAEISNDT